jgi:hypothetical protein
MQLLEAALSVVASLDRELGDRDRVRVWSTGSAN